MVGARHHLPHHCRRGSDHKAQSLLLRLHLSCNKNLPRVVEGKQACVCYCSDQGLCGSEGTLIFTVPGLNHTRTSDSVPDGKKDNTIRRFFRAACSLVTQKPFQTKSDISIIVAHASYHMPLSLRVHIPK